MNYISFYSRERTLLLTLVDDFTQAAAWHVTLYEHGNFRGGPGDVSVQIALAEWATIGRLDEQGSPTHVARNARSGSGGGSQEMVLSVEASTKEPVLVPDSKLAKSDPKTGYFLYDVAWELTPDADAPMKEGMKMNDDMHEF